MTRILTVLVLLMTASASWGGAPKVVARFSYAVPPAGSVPEVALHSTKRRPAMYRLTGYCYDGSIPGLEPDPVVHYTRYEDDVEADLSACDNNGDQPIFVAPNTPLVFRGRFAGTITTGLKGVVILERVAEFE
jgi:hypothetical protein